MVHGFKVATTLAAYRCVSCVTGTAEMVEYPDTTSALIIGITTDTVKDTTGTIPVKTAGEIAQLYFNDTCTSGEAVAADSSGRGIPFAYLTTLASTIQAAYVGVLIGADVAATGTVARVLIQPGR